jgi:hypothetical protein
MKPHFPVGEKGMMMMIDNSSLSCLKMNNVEKFKSAAKWHINLFVSLPVLL